MKQYYSRTSTVDAVNTFSGNYTLEDCFNVLVSVIEANGGVYLTKNDALATGKKSTGQLLYQYLQNSYAVSSNNQNWIIASYMISVLENILKTNPNGYPNSYPALVNTFLVKIKAVVGTQNNAILIRNTLSTYKITSQDIPAIVTLFYANINAKYLKGSPHHTLKVYADQVLQHVSTYLPPTQKIVPVRVNDNKVQKFEYNVKFTDTYEVNSNIFAIISTKDGVSARTKCKVYINKQVNKLYFYSGETDIFINDCFRIETNEEPKLLSFKAISSSNKSISEESYYYIEEFSVIKVFQQKK